MYTDDERVCVYSWRRNKLGQKTKAIFSRRNLLREGGDGCIVSKICKRKKRIVFELFGQFLSIFEMIESISFFLGVKVSAKIRVWCVVTPSPSQFSPFPDSVINGFRELGSLRSSRNYEETTPSFPLAGNVSKTVAAH